MAGTVIKIENLGKRYQIRHDRRERETIREALARKFFSLIDPSKKAHSSMEDFWALKGISLEIKRGECVGIIGRNGAGKSTLLKVVSRITEPTTGRIELHGRIASLLEVGTGFHQELTGRENIYLNGTILGMRKKEIDRKFDEIVAFADIEKFLDTPVKRYSSGMYVRLAFAVAAHMEPEILIVDEVLAVGDAAFQKKCLGKMGEISAKEGITVLFVSHNMGAVRSLCSEVGLLKNGEMVFFGQVEKTIEQYISSNDVGQIGKIDLTAYPRNSKYSPMPAITEAWIETYDGKVSNDFFTGTPFRACFKFKTERIIKDPMVGVTIKNIYGDIVTYINSRHVKKIFKDTDRGTVRFDLGVVPLMPGKYTLSVQLYENVENYVDVLVDVLSFTMIPSGLVDYTGGIFYIQPDDIAILEY